MRGQVYTQEPSLHSSTCVGMGSAVVLLVFIDTGVSSVALWPCQPDHCCIPVNPHPKMNRCAQHYVAAVNLTHTGQRCYLGRVSPESGPYSPLPSWQAALLFMASREDFGRWMGGWFAGLVVTSISFSLQADLLFIV